MGERNVYTNTRQFSRYPWNITPKAKNSTSRIGFDPQPARPPQPFSITRYSIVRVCVRGGGIIIEEFLEPKYAWRWGSPFILMMLVIATRISIRVTRAPYRDVINHAHLSSEIGVGGEDARAIHREMFATRCIDRSSIELLSSQRTTPGLNPIRNCRGYQRLTPRLGSPPFNPPLLLRTYVRSRRWARAVIYSGSNLNKEHGTPAEECSHSSSFFYNTSYKRPARRERNK